MELVSPENQFQLFLDDVRLPADALVGAEDAAIAQLFAGLNPERIMGAASAVGMGRYALNKAVDYVKTRQVWKTPIGAHQGLSHPLAQNHIEIELAKLMMQKAATLYDRGDDVGAAEAANMAKYAAAEASVRAVDQAVQTLGGNGLTKEYGIAAAVTASQAGPHRAGQPRDDPQLRRADLARSATLVLMSTLVHYTVDGSVARLTLDSPHNRNALSTALVNQLRQGLRRRGRRLRGAGGGARPHRRNVLRGRRPVARPAGGDPGDVAVDRARELTQLLRAILELPKPVIGADRRARARRRARPRRRVRHRRRRAAAARSR